MTDSREFTDDQNSQAGGRAEFRLCRYSELACTPVFGEVFLGFLTQFEPLSTSRIGIGIGIGIETPLGGQRIFILPFLPLSLLPIRFCNC